MGCAPFDDETYFSRFRAKGLGAWVYLLAPAVAVEEQGGELSYTPSYQQRVFGLAAGRTTEQAHGTCLVSKEKRRPFMVRQASKGLIGRLASR